MKQHRGIYLPDDEQHMIDMMDASGVFVEGKPTYQYGKYRAALAYCKTRRTAIDIGANVGLWSRVMCLDFKTVFAFEPVAAYRECLRLNAPDALVHGVALGDMNCGAVNMEQVTPGSCGDTRIKPITQLEDFDPSLSVSVYKLDSLHYDNVDLIKIDTEGYELFVIRGGMETIKRNRPVMIVEQKPNHASAYGLGDTDAIAELKGIGMVVAEVLAGDYIMRFPK